MPANGLITGWGKGGWPGRFEMLDAWRGLAAVAVVVHHLGYGRSFNLGHNAVILFFVISGYCISAAAESCIKSGLGFRQYMWRRIRRIYPPYFFALLFFFVTRLLKADSGLGAQFPTSMMGWIQNFTLTQWLTQVLEPSSWAAQNKTLVVTAFWSLNYEEQFYLVMGALIATQVLLKRSLLSGIGALLVLAIAWNVYFPTTSYGLFIEYWVQFGVGCLVYYRLCRIKHSAGRWLVDAVLVVLATVSVWMVWFGGNTWSAGNRIVYLEWFVCTTFALVLIALRPLSAAFSGTHLGRWLMALGLITYSLYLVHQFNLTAAAWVSSKLLPRWAPVVVDSAVQLMLLVGLGAVFWYLFERPFLNTRVVAVEGLKPRLERPL